MEPDARAQGDAVLELDGVRKVFAGPSGPVVAIDRLDLVVRRGERVAIVGQTGAGKSTSLNLLLGLMAPSEGEVRVLGVDPFLDFEALAGRTSVVFQQDRLLPWLDASANAAFGLAMLGLPRDVRRERAVRWLHRLGLAGFEDARPHELSGGMRQRVAIARAMCVEPDIFVADEAFSSLDELTAHEVRADLTSVIEETGTTAVIVTHSVDDAVRMAHRVVVLVRPGRIFGEVAVPVGGGESDIEAAAVAVRSMLESARLDPPSPPHRAPGDPGSGR